MTTDAIDQIASMTTRVTTVATLALAEPGKLALDDSMAQHRPEFADCRCST